VVSNLTNVNIAGVRHKQRAICHSAGLEAHPHQEREKTLLESHSSKGLDMDSDRLDLMSRRRQEEEGAELGSRQGAVLDPPVVA